MASEKNDQKGRKEIDATEASDVFSSSPSPKVHYMIITPRKKDPYSSYRLTSLAVEVSASQRHFKLALARQSEKLQFFRLLRIKGYKLLYGVPFVVHEHKVSKVFILVDRRVFLRTVFYPGFSGV